VRRRGPRSRLPPAGAPIAEFIATEGDERQQIGQEYEAKKIAAPHHIRRPHKDRPMPIALAPMKLAPDFADENPFLLISILRKIQQCPLRLGASRCVGQSPLKRRPPASPHLRATSVFPSREVELRKTDGADQRWPLAGSFPSVIDRGERSREVSSGRAAPAPATASGSPAPSSSRAGCSF
jgi:hypothetical protein